MTQMTNAGSILIAVDIGNSRMKLGLFPPAAEVGGEAAALPTPASVLELPITHATGEFDAAKLADWCKVHEFSPAHWLVASVHRGAADRLAASIHEQSDRSGRQWAMKQLSHRDVPLKINVDSPERVGIDRLVAAAAANHVRPSARAAIIVEVGTAITVDFVDAHGVFQGGAILPGLSLSARALEEHTDALPRVTVEAWQSSPRPIGKSTVAAIESGIFWGAVGAIRELVAQFSAGSEEHPMVILSGGGSKLIAETLSATFAFETLHMSQLVLSGIALVDAQLRQRGAI